MHGFVHETRRDRLKRRRQGRSEKTSSRKACRGQRGRQRRSETPETKVVWLITQRSRVQIPPPLPRPEALSRTEKGPFAVVRPEVCKLTL